jgi:uncharacterized protein (DUF3084 family)
MSVNELKYHEERLEYLKNLKDKIRTENIKIIYEYEKVIEAIKIVQEQIDENKRALKKQSKYLAQFQESKQ